MKAGSRLSISAGIGQNIYNLLVEGELLPSSVFTYTTQEDYDLYHKHMKNFQRRIGNDEYTLSNKFATDERIELTGLKKFETSQRSIDNAYVLKLLKQGYKNKERMLIVRDGNKLWIENGHHRLIAAIVRGEKSMIIPVIDITPRR